MASRSAVIGHFLVGAATAATGRHRGRGRCRRTHRFEADEYRSCYRSSRAQAGSLKSATERRRSAASWARLPIDSAVWLAPCEVCAVIDWMVFIVLVMLVAAADCCCAALEIPWMRSARLVDTFSISPSAVPASSASRAPATTSEVVCSIELTASL